MSRVTVATCVGEKYNERSTSCGQELHPCQFTDRPSSSLLRFDDVDSQSICNDVEIGAGVDQGPSTCISGPRYHRDVCTWSVPAVRADREPELSAWACRHCVFVPVVGAEGLPVPVTRTTRSRTAEIGRLARSGSRTAYATPENRDTVRTPVSRRSPVVGSTQSPAFKPIDDTAFCQYRNAEDGWSTSIYAEHYRRHCTADNVGSVAVGERTLADLDPADDPYLRKLRSAG